jgi:hypothetical protein
VTPRTDAYLLGAVLHEVLTGHPPHTGDDVEQVLLAAALCAPHTYPPSVPSELAELCSEACHADPDARVADAGTFRTALARVLDHRASVAAAASARGELDRLRALLAAGVGDDSSFAQRVHRQFGVCRFGFEQALRGWPGNREARDGLEESLVVMTAFELEMGSVATAEIFAAELSEVPADLEARLQEARLAADAQREAGAWFAALRREMRFAGRTWARSAITVLNGLITFGALIWAAHRVEATGGTVSADANLEFGAWAGAAVILGIFPFRRSILDNLIYRRLMTVFALWAALAVLNRAVTVWLQLPFLATLAGDGMLCCATMMALAVTVDRALWVSLAWCLAGFGIALAYAEHAITLIAWGYLLHGFYLGWVLRTGRARDVVPSRAIRP